MLPRLSTVPCTQDVRVVPTQFRFNVGPASQPIAGSMPTNHHYLNTGPAVYVAAAP